MSFLEVLNRVKNNLRTTSTIITTVSGDLLLEKRNGKGEVNVERIGSSPGYVVDLKPDLQVAVVLPGLCMGSQDVTQELSLLRAYSVTHILSVGVHINQLQGMEYFYIEALDLPEFDLRPILKESIQLIDNVIESGGVVFVHCNAGVSRSASVVIAYLMKSKKCRYQEAYEILQKVRSCIKPNEGYARQLKLFESNLLK